MSEFVHAPFIKYKKVGLVLLMMGFFSSTMLFVITLLEQFRAQLIPQAPLYIQLIAIFNLLVTLCAFIYYMTKSKETLTFNRRGVSYTKAKGTVWEKDWRELRYAYRQNHPEGPEFLVLSPIALNHDEVELLIVKAAAKGKLIFDNKVVCSADEETYASIRRIMDAVIPTIV